MQRPLVIYSMPRTRSYAALEAARRTERLDEPFGFWKLFPNHSSECYNLPSYFNSLISAEQWQSIERAMASPTAAVKLFGYHFYEVKAARAWWQQIQTANTHEIIVLERDRVEICYSMLMARITGYWRQNEREAIRVNVNDSDLLFLHRYIDCHIRWYPQVGRRVTWDRLPQELFDKSQIQQEPQQNLQRLDLIANGDWVAERIIDLMSFFGDEWDRAESQLIPW